jgi:hypothetical protein
MMNILVFGATSAIVKHILREYAGQGNCFYLIARNREKLDLLERDLKARGAGDINVDYLDCSNLPAVVEKCKDLFSNKTMIFDLILVAHGLLPDQSQCESSVEKLEECISINITSSIVILSSAFGYLENVGQGKLVVISSVAGDRIRASNYIYGVSKKTVSSFLEGLHLRNTSNKIKIIDIKPGMTITPMTKDFNHGMLWSEPSTISKSIIKAIEEGKRVSYHPFYWRFIMLVIKLLPIVILKNLKNI